jgi:leader peptidase (prepilin peptidase)/N-methyltransferase
MVYLALILLGLCFGSFVNALVWRLHQQSLPKKKQTSNRSDLSIVKGRSMCVECGHELSARDLIPVISWLSLNGKCRYCKKSISWQYPVVEILTALFFVVAYGVWQNYSQLDSELWFLMFVGFLAAIVLSMALVVYDFKWHILPNKLVFSLAVVGAYFAVLSLLGSDDIKSGIVNIIFGIGVSGGIFWVLYQISNGKWIGGGDVKLGFALGLFLLTPINSFLMIFLASLLGSLYSLTLMFTKKYKKQMHIPFGPFLLLATYIIVIYGNQIIDTYKDFLYL